MKYLKTSVIVGMIIMLFTTLMCNRSQQKSIADLESKLKIADTKNSVFSSKVNELGQHIATQNQTIVSGRAALDELKKENSKLKKVVSNVKPTISTQIVEVLVPYNDKPDIKKLDTNTYMKVPIGFSHTSNKWYKINGTVDTNGINIANISVINELSITVGSERQGIFKKPKPIVTVKNENPYTETIKLSNIVVQEKPKWYERKLVWLGAGIVGGYFIAK